MKKIIAALTVLAVAAIGMLGSCRHDLASVKIVQQPGDISLALIGLTADSAAVSVRWKASTDPSGISRYDWRDSITSPVPCCLTTGSTTFLSDTLTVARPPLNGRINHEFRVRAVDLQNNAGSWSTIVKWAITRPDRIGPNPPDSVFVDSLIETSDIVEIGVWPENVSIKVGKKVQFYTGFLSTDGTGYCNIAGVSRDTSVLYNYTQWPGACDSAVRVAWRKSELRNVYRFPADMLKTLALR